MKHGIGSNTIAIGADADEAAIRSAVPKDVRLICLSYIDPLSTLHLRHAVQIARREFRGSQVILGIWRERDTAMGRQLSRAARADVMVPTIGRRLSLFRMRAASDHASGGVHQGLYLDKQLGEIDWFRVIIVTPRSQCFFLVAGHCVCGQGDDGHPSGLSR